MSTQALDGNPAFGGTIAHAFNATVYRVALPGGALDLRVGNSNADLTRRLSAEARVRRDWAIVTPFNAGAQRERDSVNYRRLNQLQAFLERDQHCWFAATNIDPTAAWPAEEGVFVVDPGLAYAALLAQWFGQLALVHGEVCGRPHLHWL